MTRLARSRFSSIAFLFTTILLALTMSALAQTREEKVRADKRNVEAEGFWIYGDLAAGIEKARETGKPLLVALRCIPCEECVKLDDDMIHKNPRIRDLLDRFVCVRIVSTNGLDLATFQYDYDQSFAAFLMNAEGGIYGRFGTRSHRTYWSDDVSVEGMAEAMEGALALHDEWPANREALAGKRGPTPEVATPEKFPTFEGRYAARIDYEGEVVKSCIHCHQIGDAARSMARASTKSFPEKLLFSYPHPKYVGLILDPTKRAVVKSVAPGSAAQRAGFQPGDEIVTLAGQPLLSIADAQWVLHQTAPEGAELAAEIVRDGEARTLTLALDEGWRRAEDLSWRASSWELRRMILGGLLLEPLSAEAREERGLPEDATALRVKHVGQYGDHAIAKQAGVLVDDILVAVDGRDDLPRETDVLAYGMEHRRPGETIELTLLRDGQRRTVDIRQQK